MFCNSWQLGISYKIYKKIPSIGILYIIAFLKYRNTETAVFIVRHKMRKLLEGGGNC